VEAFSFNCLKPSVCGFKSGHDLRFNGHEGPSAAPEGDGNADHQVNQGEADPQNEQKAESEEPPSDVSSPSEEVIGDFDKGSPLCPDQEVDNAPSGPATEGQDQVGSAPSGPATEDPDQVGSAPSGPATEDPDQVDSAPSGPATEGDDEPSVSGFDLDFVGVADESDDYLGILPGLGIVSNAVAVRLSRDPSKRKSFMRQMSDAADKIKDNRYRRTEGIHYGPKTYAYYSGWLPYDLYVYCFMLGLDYRKSPCKTNVSAVAFFIGKQLFSKFNPFCRVCMGLTFSRVSLVKMIIEHLEKWDVLEDYSPSNREEWEIFKKAHAEMAEKKTIYENSDPWTDEQADVFLQRLRLLHIKDLLFPMKLCDLLGTGVAKKIPGLGRSMDGSPYAYYALRRGITGPMLKAFYGGSKEVCQRAVDAIRGANVPFDLAFNLLKRPFEFKRRWGDYIRSVFVAARQQYLNRATPFDWQAYKGVLERRREIEEYIAKRREERRLKQEPGDDDEDFGVNEVS
jgi:hypothetical protein